MDERWRGSPIEKRGTETTPQRRGITAWSDFTADWLRAVPGVGPGARAFRGGGGRNPDVLKVTSMRTRFAATLRT